VRKDDATGKAGLRVRRGLGTQDKAEAEKLRDELNKLLAEPRFHDPAARADAERQFDKRVVDIFFYKMLPEEPDFVSLRDEAIALPKSEPDGYRHVLLLGTTGAGKTTLVRQMIGTDPKTERFPSTSTAKTTVHDTEILMEEGGWRAVATFVSSEEAREYLNECISAAVLAAAKGANESTVRRRLLNHVNQRFRFSYVLGSGPKSKSTPSSTDFEDEDDEGETEPELFAPEELGEIDLAATNEALVEAVAQVRKLAKRLGDHLRQELGAGEEKDKRVLEEIFEEELDNLLRDEDAFHEVADSLMDEIEKRFDLLPDGEVRRTKQGWPLSWSGEWQQEDRKEFLKAITRFSSNYAPFFGRLLTPLVNGMRVAGPFSPTWTNGNVPKLVLFDGEGLGHTPKSTASVSTSVTRRIESVDAVLLVDNSTQPMQAAPLSAMREVVATGNARKLILAFTHFDEVKGDNLPTASAKAQHVLASAENVLAAFGQELGPFAERALRKRLEEARFFLAGLQEPLSDSTQAGKRTISQLRKLLEAIDKVIERPQPAQGRPVYDRINLAMAIRSAAEGFQDAWSPRLGLAHKPGIGKEHWTRVKALTRRLATGMADEYDTLKPVADLRKELVERIYVFIQNPLRWEGPDPSPEERQGTYDAFADGIGRRLLDLSTRRVWTERAAEWQSAFDKRGTGSTFVRAKIIGEQIYEPAAPVPDATPSPDRNQFLRDVVADIEAAAADVGAQLL
jgi:energy-coupling factor transporter ATP-binding protein EcfA2